MAYTLAKINIRELKKNQPVGLQEFNLIDGIIPVSIDGYTKIADSTPPIDGEFSYYPTEDKLYINNGSIQAEQYVNYSLLVSNKNGAQYALDPTNEEATKYKWPPYFKKAPNVVESVNNFLSGLISYSDIPLDLQSGTDINLRKFFGSNFSINGQGFFLWRVQEDKSILKIYTGVGQSVRFETSSIKYSAIQKMKKLDDAADWGCPLYPIKEQTPIINAAKMPFINTFTKQESTTFGGGTIAGEGLSWNSFDISDTPKIRVDFSNGSYLEAYLGIFFGSYSHNNFKNAPDLIGSINLSNQEGEIWSYDTRTKQAESYINYKHTFRMVSSLNGDDLSSESQYEYFRHPLDCYSVTYGAGGQTRSGNITFIGSKNFRTRSRIYGWASYSTGNLPYDQDEPMSVFSGLPRQKIVYKNNAIYNKNVISDQSEPDRDEGANNSCLNNVRILIPDTSYFSNDIVTTGFGNAYSISKRINYSNLGTGHTDISERYLGLDGAFDFYYHHDLVDGITGLSMKEFIETTCTAADISVDLTDIDFDEQMQFIKYWSEENTYRTYLQYLNESLGIIFRYDSNTETLKALKIDPSLPTVFDFNENNFSGLSITLNTNDTYDKVIFSNETLAEKDFTNIEDFSSFNYYQEFNANNTLNQRPNVKKIELITMESSRAQLVADLNMDNKFNYKWSASTDAEGVNIGDWVSLTSDQIPDDNETSKILITKKVSGETSLQFEGIKFASIN